MIAKRFSRAGSNEHPDDVFFALDTNEAFRKTVTHRLARMSYFPARAALRLAWITAAPK
jgi:hypothetical protein